MNLVSHTPDEVVEGVVEGVFEGVLEGVDRYLPGIRVGGVLPRYLSTYLPRSG